ncbi:MAG: helix-turn-helix transcriptional regulator [Shimia sp.]|uniref:helix-turn-helix transcriptional regulator n=1 Tax=Shimia sp. TaxID=1954381 RepID=UPI004059489D
MPPAPHTTAPGFGVAIYLVSASLFAFELFSEITGIHLINISWQAHELIELAAFLGFFVGGVLIWRAHRQLSNRNQEVERHLRAAQGELFAMLEAQFDRWHLSKAERDVALLTVKGLSVAEIAGLRETSPGTIKSQNNAIYLKAGVKSRTQLLGHLIDELLVMETVLPSQDPKSQSEEQAPSEHPS